MVQTGALIVQTEATQHNTQTLRRIASNLTAAPFALVGIAASFLVSMLGAGVKLDDMVTKGHVWTTNEWVFASLAAYFVFVVGLAFFEWVRSE